MFFYKNHKMKRAPEHAFNRLISLKLQLKNASDRFSLRSLYLNISEISKEYQ